jgi:hypothetical protein
MRLVRFAGIALGLYLCFVFGCVTIHDVSDLPPYPNWIGTTDRLNCECELWKDGRLFVIFVPVGGKGNGHEYAILPAGTKVKIEAIQQEDDSKDKPYDYAVVTLDDPKNPKERIRAGVRFRFLTKMAKLEK